MNIRKACVADVPRIKKLIEDHMKEGFMLPRPLSELYENLRDFFVIEIDDEVHGCVGLHIAWGNLAEIISLVVDHHGRKKGCGKALIDACLDEAKQLRIRRVFALTKIPDFFIRFGFDILDKAELPHKVWAGCIKCPKFPNCDEIAVSITVCDVSDEELDIPNSDMMRIPGSF
jgi:amino-acid N-acetyltransferase